MVVEAAPSKIDNYIVKKGDTLYAIAAKYGTTVSTLMNINNLSTPNLSIGQSLKLPSATDNKSNTYIVKAGDSLYAIAGKYDTDVQTLKDMNNLSTNNLSIGQVLKIPISSANNVYTVVPGDSLYSIARKFNTTVDVIKKANNLSTNLLSIGQKLVIP